MTHQRHVRTLAGLLVAGFLAALAAGCGGHGASPGVAAIGTTTTATTTTTAQGGSPSTAGSGDKVQAAEQFSACMRSHGVPKFPDPTTRGGGLTINVGSGINPSSPQFQAAQRACARYLPNGGRPPSPAQQAKMQQQALKFSACMRSHGVPSFPDPEFKNGGIGIKISPGSGIDPRSPQFQAAQKACQADLPGKLPGKAVAAGNGKAVTGGFGAGNTVGGR